MTLVLVLLAAVGLAGLARRSMLGALESRAGVEELQRRWAVTSLRSTLSMSIERLLEEAERGGASPLSNSDQTGDVPKVYLNAPQARVRQTCHLAGVRYDLVLTDEQAKLNVNHLIGRDGRSRAQLAVKRLVRRTLASNASAIKVNFQRTGRGGGGARTPMLLGFGQLFDHASPTYLVGEGHRKGVAETLTCWGDGKVSLRRAPDEVIEQACEKDLGKGVVSSLLAARKQNPYRDLNGIVKGMRDVDGDRLTKVFKHVTDRSTCHGLWIIAHGEQRAWYTLMIVDTGATSNAVYKYAW